MKVLILGGGGMLGHKLVQSWRERFDVWATVRSDFRRYERFGIFQADKLIPHVQADNFETVVNALAIARPAVVVNCIGVIKQLPNSKDPISTLTLNSIFPHRLAGLCRATGARLITLSTDCVFSGRQGNYAETDFPDAGDLYGRSKFLGEIGADEQAVTVRTSIIGREIETAHSLIEWFLANCGKTIKGYRNAIFSGFPTITLAEVLADIIENHPNLHGLWHAASDPISKYELLKLARDAYRADLEIEPDDDFHCDRSLNAEKFNQIINFRPPDWATMIERMANDATPYDAWREIPKNKTQVFQTA